MLGLPGLRARTQIELSGADRKHFLHSFCTNDIDKLEPGAGCEAFIPDVKGKVLGFGNVFCYEQSLIVESVPGQAERISGHLDRYIILEDVQLCDRTDDWQELLVAGAKAPSFLQELVAADFTLGLCEHGEF